MRARAGDERESASVTAARQLAEEAQQGWWAPRPSRRGRRPALRRPERRTGQDDDRGRS